MVLEFGIQYMLENQGYRIFQNDINDINDINHLKNDINGMLQYPSILSPALPFPALSSQR
jgi:hypothetical protein